MWAIRLDLYAIVEAEANRQMYALPEAEAIENNMQRGYNFDEIMELKRDVKGDCIWKCWN